MTGAARAAKTIAADPEPVNAVCWFFLLCGFQFACYNEGTDARPSLKLDVGSSSATRKTRGPSE
jgi:hypothetical protein